MNAMVGMEPRARRVALPTRGGEMAVLDFGPADRPVDVVFSHANGFNARTYRTILAPLGDALRILAVDMRGHGASTLPAIVEDREGWHEFRDDLLALLEAEASGPVVLAGHSMGGTSSLLAAAAAPERVRALALFDPVIFTPSQRAGDMTDNPLADGALRRRAQFASKAAAVEAYTGRGAFRSWRPEQLADYVEAGFREAEDGTVSLTCAPAWEASNFRTHHYDPWGAFRATRCPVRILRAELGSTARLEEGQDDLLATGRFQIDVIAGSSHFLPMERPELVRKALLELSA
jgi:pimeloyl-ACP methyl ester carboxylesterase